MPPRKIEKLSEAFINLHEAPELELTCLSVNINPDGDNEFLEHREEVKKMSLIDMTFEKREQIFRREEREDGLQQGLQNTVFLLKEFIPDPDDLLEKIRNCPGYEDATLEMIKQYM